LPTEYTEKKLKREKGLNIYAFGKGQLTTRHALSWLKSSLAAVRQPVRGGNLRLKTRSRAAAHGIHGKKLKKKKG
jgi:hypothetical protein